MQKLDRKLTELQISHLMQNIQYRLEMIKKQEGIPSNLDLDGLKDKIRELYDQVIQLEASFATDEPDKNPPVTPEKPKPAKAAEPVQVEKEKKTEVSEVREVVSPPESTANIPAQRKMDVLGEKKTILADKFLEEDDKTVAARIKKNPINDLKMAIGVNDKFLFIKELFQGDMDAYNAAIRKLNSFQILDEARYFLGELSRNHQWKDDSEYFARLKDLVERKYL
ncbi:MAG: hypothetical protein KKA81_04900 [Bacteroidetes bacterium]|nr:hypothetical protein [Bacteroidota bacterium]